MSADPLPNGWSSVPLKDVCHQISDGTHKTPNYQESGVRFISIKNIRPFQPIDWDAYVRFVSEAEHKELCKRCRPQPDDILFPRIGTLGFAKRIDFTEPVSIFVGLGILKPDNALVRPKYLEYYMNAPWIAQMSRERANGSGRMTLPLEESREFPFYLAPLNEQDRIVAEIEKQLTRLDDAVAALKRLQANLKRYRASVLKAACEGRLVPTEAELARKEGRNYEPASELLKRILAERRAKWEADQLQKMIAAGKPPKNDEWKKKYKNPEPPNTSVLSTLPEGWAWATFDQLSIKIVDGTHFTPTYQPEGIPFLSVKDIYDGIIHFDDCKYISEKEHCALSHRCNAQPGDLLLTKSGTIGRVAVVQSGPEFSLFVSVALVKPASSNCAAKWMAIAFENWFQTVNVGNDIKGSAIKNLHLEDIRPLCIPVPPLEEQQRIIQSFERAESIRKALDCSVDVANKRLLILRQAILNSAFSGKLVPQDPNDEPASVLLERIRAERARAQEQKWKTLKAANGASPVNGQRRKPGPPTRAAVARDGVGRRANKLAQPAKAGKG